MTIRPLKICLVILGYVYAVVGTWLFWDPHSLLLWLDIETTASLPVNVLSEIRASYGGAYITIGAFMLWAALTGTWMRGALMLALLISGGHCAGRLASVALDGSPSGGLYGSIVLEAIVSLYAFIVLVKVQLPKD